MTTRPTSSVAAVMCSPRSSPAQVMVMTGRTSWTWLICAIGPMARPRYQSKAHQGRADDKCPADGLPGAEFAGERLPSAYPMADKTAPNSRILATEPRTDGSSGFRAASSGDGSPQQRGCRSEHEKPIRAVFRSSRPDLLEEFGGSNRCCDGAVCLVAPRSDPL
jgi:hypothetical protein